MKETSSQVTLTTEEIEEQIFPIDTWGLHYVAARSPARDGTACRRARHPALARRGAPARG